jgi:ABC-2 type transport system ATP-binding protein
MTSKPIVELKQVTKRYGFSQALKPVNLTLMEPGIIGLIGPNGSGKSTLLKLMAGLIRKTSGELYVSGQPVSRLIANQVAFHPEVDSLYRFFSVQETMNYAERVFPDFDRQKAQSIMEALKIDGQQKIKHMSKGNRAKVKLVVTLSRKVPLLLLDEPLSGLDPLVREEILKMIARFAEIENQTMIISTHEVTEVEPLLDHVICLRSGEILLSEKVETLREQRGKSVLEIMREVLV